MLEGLRSLLSSFIVKSIQRSLAAGDFHDALEQSQKLYIGRERHSGPASFFARSLIGLNRLDEALEVLQVALEHDPHPNIAALQCNCLHELSRHEEMLRVARKYVGFFPGETIFLSYTRMAATHLQRFECESEARALSELNEKDKQEWEQVILQEYVRGKTESHQGGQAK